MQKKYKILIIIFLLIFVIGFLYTKFNKAKTQAPAPATFTFGEFLGITKKIPVQAPSTNNSENPITTDNTTQENIPKNSLSKISDVSVAGFEIVPTEEKTKEGEIVVNKISPDYVFENNIKAETKGGKYGEDIRKIQKELNRCSSTIISKTGAGSPGKETNEFKNGTIAAIKVFQEILQIEKTGNFDEATRTAMNKEWNCPSSKNDSLVTKYIPSVMYTERATGHVYQNLLDNKSSSQITNTTIPTVYESYLLDNNIIFRRLKSDQATIENFIGKIIKSTTNENNTIKSELLPDGITSISTNTSTQEIFYTNKSNGHTTGVLFNSKNGTKKQIFDSSFSEWNSALSLKGPIITTKPSASVLGYSYLINKENKTIQKIMGDILGLTVKPNIKGTSILYSRAKNSSIELALYNLEQKNNQVLGIKTLSEKCVFDNNDIYIYCAVPSNIPPGKYPDDWYMGKTSFVDSIVRYKILDGSIDKILEQVNGSSMDIEGIKIDSDSKFLIIKNKVDGKLWLIDLNIALSQIPNNNSSISPDSN